MKKKFKRWTITFIISLLSFFMGIVSNIITNDWIENKDKGQIIFNYDGIFKGEVIIESQNGQLIKLREIQSGKNIKLDSGQYTISQNIGNIQIKIDTIEIERKKTIIYELEKNTDHIFSFMMDVNKKIYGPGDPIALTLFSTKNVWIFFYSIEDGEAKKMNAEGIFLNAYTFMQIDNIVAKGSFGKDNIIAIAIEKNDVEFSDNCFNTLFLNTKSNIIENHTNWRSQWETFFVE